MIHIRNVSLDQMADRNDAVFTGIRLRTGDEFLFSPFNDETIVTKARYRHMFDTVMQQLNMSHTPHECRHTFVSMLDDAGANKVSIQKIAGHKGSDVTEKVYTHKNIEQLLSAIDLLKV